MWWCGVSINGLVNILQISPEVKITGVWFKKLSASGQRPGAPEKCPATAVKPPLLVQLKTGVLGMFESKLLWREVAQ